MQGWKARQAAARERMADKSERIKGRREYYESKGLAQFARPMEADPLVKKKHAPKQAETVIPQGAGGDGAEGEQQAVYEAKHKQFGRWYILKNGEEYDAGPYAKDEVHKLVETLNSGNVPRQDKGNKPPENVVPAPRVGKPEAEKPEGDEAAVTKPSPQPAPASETTGSGESEFLSEDEAGERPAPPSPQPAPPPSNKPQKEDGRKLPTQGAVKADGNG